MKDKINLDEIIWINTNMDWMRRVLYDYTKAGKNIGMNYLSLGSLRYDENYFVGYIFDEKDIASPIDLVAYIQYKIYQNKLILNYMEVAERYRGNGITNKIINNFVSSLTDYLNSHDVEIIVTTISSDGERANLMGKLQNIFPGEITETSKRNLI